MNRFLILMGLLIAFCVWSPVATAQSRAPCRRVCSQRESCVSGRCIELCRPGCRPATSCSPSGTCEPILSPQEPKETESERNLKYGAKSKDFHSALVMDVGGIVGFGVSAGYEMGEAHSFNFRFKFMNTGLLSYQVLPRNEFESFDWGVGLTLGYRHYEARWGNLRGFYYGGGLGWSLNQVTSGTSKSVSRVTNSLSPFAELGYRWVFGQFIFGFGPLITAAAPVAQFSKENGNVDCVNDALCGESSVLRLEGSFVVELGWMLNAMKNQQK